ncbi:MAG: hypothetical protein JWM27_1976 [Gemmatimonadetes bacterium]|nr:hypothetical protein [Gemmatimonadota bacterium]
MTDPPNDPLEISAASMGVADARTDAPDIPGASMDPDGSSASGGPEGAGASDGEDGKDGEAERKPGRAPRPVFSGAWEQELIISGAVVFALLQFPPVVDGLMRRTAPHLAGVSFAAAIGAYEYVKLILTTLIASFVVHLCGRAYWVGLIGLNSVFPAGVRYDELRAGPVTKEVYARRLPTLPRLIAVADDACSIIFSAAFMLVLLFAVTVVWSGVAGLVAWVLTERVLGGRYGRPVFFGVTALLFVPLMLAAALDRLAGDRMPPAGRRVTRWVMETAMRALAYGAWAPIMLTLNTNFRRGWATPLLMLAMFGLIGLNAVQMVAALKPGSMSLNGSAYLPAATDGRALRAEFYEDQRDDDAVYARIPSIQSDVVRDPYLRLFLPYSAPVQDPIVAARCPGVRPLRGGRARAAGQPSDAEVDALVACLLRLQPVTLNGRPLAGVRFRLYTQPRSGLSGLLAHVPVDGLPKGENELRVAVPPPADPADAPGTPAPPYVIRFWL